MSKKIKTLFIVATAFIIIGSIIFAGVMTMLKWDFRKLSTVKYVENNYQIEEEYKNISIITKTADIFFEQSVDGKTKINCYEMEKAQHVVKVENNALNIEIDDQRKWYHHIDIGFASPKITISLPQAEYGKLKIECKTGDVILPNNLTFTDVNITNTTGDIKLKNITTLDMSLSVSTGDIELLNVKCNNLSASGSTGDIELKNVIGTGKFTITLSTGDVDFDRCDANEINVKTSTGDIKGSLLSDKSFDAESKTGKVEVPKHTTGGKCTLRAKTGNIKITII